MTTDDKLRSILKNLEYKEGYDKSSIDDMKKDLDFVIGNKERFEKLKTELYIERTDEYTKLRKVACKEMFKTYEKEILKKIMDEVYVSGGESYINIHYFRYNFMKNQPTCFDDDYNSYFNTLGIKFIYVAGGNTL